MAAGSLLPKAAAPDQQVFGPTYLRGYWELSLPPLAPTPRAAPKAQLGHDARVLVACFRRTVRRQGSRVLQDDKVPFPLASGRAEHLIPAEKSEVVASPAASATSAVKRAAAKRRAKRRR